jgi:hypothetical protein
VFGGGARLGERGWIFSLAGRQVFSTRIAPKMGAQYRDARRVRFSNVVIRTHAVVLDGSKLPSDGCAPLGLGAPVGELTRSVDEHETQRAAGSPGVRLVSTEDRREAVGDDAELFAVEQLNQQIILNACGAQAEDDSSSIFESRECSPDPFEVDQAGPASGSEPERLPTYSTAAADAKRSGHGGGYCEVDEEAEERRKRRALDAAAATETRKAEKRRCKSCKRFACICC